MDATGLSALSTEDLLKELQRRGLTTAGAPAAPADPPEDGGQTADAGAGAAAKRQRIHGPHRPQKQQGSGGSKRKCSGRARRPPPRARHAAPLSSRGPARSEQAVPSRARQRAAASAAGKPADDDEAETCSADDDSQDKGRSPGSVAHSIDGDSTGSDDPVFIDSDADSDAGSEHSSIPSLMSMGSMSGQEDEDFAEDEDWGSIEDASFSDASEMSAPSSSEGMSGAKSERSEDDDDRSDLFSDVAAADEPEMDEEDDTDDSRPSDEEDDDPDELDAAEALEQLISRAKRQLHRPAPDAAWVQPREIELSAEQLAALQANEAQQFEYMRMQNASLGKLCHFPLLGPEGIARCVLQPGSYLMEAPEQTNKTVNIAGAGVTCMSVKVPHITIIADGIDNVQATAGREKLDKILGEFEGEVKYLGGVVKDWEALGSSRRDVADFKAGKLQLVLPAHTTAMAHLNTFLEDRNISGYHITLDEADAMLSTAVKREDFESGKPLYAHTQREKELHRLIGLPPLGPGSRCRSILWVSATHTATLWWHTCWKLPFKGLVADKEKLSHSGMTLETDLELVGILDPAEITKKHKYGLYSKPVMCELRHFRKDPRVAKLMLLCLTPRVWVVDSMTLFKMARHVLCDFVPRAVCIVPHGHGVHVLFNSDDPATSLGFGVKHEAPRGTNKIGAAIEWVDRTFDLTRPVVVVGYNRVGRCASVRSERRVITHVIGYYQKGKTAGQAKQMLMRCGGRTRKLRRDHGWQSVRVVCTQGDFDLVQQLYDFEAEAMEKSGTGRPEDLVAWITEQYASRFRIIATTTRRHARKSMNGPQLQRLNIAQMEGPQLDVAGNAAAGAAQLQTRHGQPVLELRRAEPGQASGSGGSSSGAGDFPICERLCSKVDGLALELLPGGSISVGGQQVEVLTKVTFVEPSHELFHAPGVVMFMDQLKPGERVAVDDPVYRGCQAAIRDVLKIKSAALNRGATAKKQLSDDMACPLSYTPNHWRLNRFYFFDTATKAAQDGAAYITQLFTMAELADKPCGFYAWHYFTEDGRIQMAVARSQGRGAGA